MPTIRLHRAKINQVFEFIWFGSCGWGLLFWFSRFAYLWKDRIATCINAATVSTVIRQRPCLTSDTSTKVAGKMNQDKIIESKRSFQCRTKSCREFSQKPLFATFSSAYELPSRTLSGLSISTFETWIRSTMVEILSPSSALARAKLGRQSPLREVEGMR